MATDPVMSCMTEEKTAILVDGGFYQKRAEHLFGKKKPRDRAQELVDYCCRHLSNNISGGNNKLYRIFYYDCPPFSTQLYHPLLQRTIDMSKSPTYVWMQEFLNELRSKRKLALRLGELQEKASSFRLKEGATKKLFRGDITLDDISERDFVPNIVQKGVDMRVGLDISSMVHKHQVTQIVLIAGDSDFVPAAKYARREGIDFILDPMWQSIRPSLNEHIDGLHSCTFDRPSPQRERLHVDYAGANATV